MDLPQPHPSLVAAFEQASNDVQISATREAAERTLGTLTAHREAIPLMFAVLQNTGSSLARFHAAKALHTAALDRWSTLSPEHRYYNSATSFRHVLINLVISKTDQLQTFERVAILRTVAFLTRRAYLEEPFTCRDTFFNHLCQSATSPQSSSQAILTSIQLVDLIIDEFTLGSRLSSSMSSSAAASPAISSLTSSKNALKSASSGNASSPIDREMFLRERQIFSSPQQGGHILPLFHAAITLLNYLTSSFPPHAYASTAFSTKALPALSIIHRVLTTDFRNMPSMSSVGVASGAVDNASGYDPSSSSFSSDALETVVINTFTKPEWHPLINQISNVLSLSFSILAALIAAPSPANNNDTTGSNTNTNNGNSVNLPDSTAGSTAVATTDTDFLSNPLHIITAIAAISHASYPSAELASEMLSTILRGINEQQWSNSPFGPVRLAYAEVWRRVSCAHGLSNVEKLPTNFILSFTTHTCQQMDSMILHLTSSATNQNETVLIDEDFSMDVIDLLLETWANLALQGDDGTSSMNHPLAPSIGDVIVHFMRMSLRTSGEHAAAVRNASAQLLPDEEEDLGFEDSSIDDSRLSVAAILTRFVLDKMADALAQSLLEAAEKVFNWPVGHGSVHGIPLDMYQEDLYFLIQLVSAVLTDEAKGEYPCVPTQFLPFNYPHTQRDESGLLLNGHTKPTGSHVQQGQMEQKRYAHTLLMAMFKTAEMESRMLGERGVTCDEASPRVGSALLEGLGRIVRTYLAPLNTENAMMTFGIVGGQQVVEEGRRCCFIKTMEGLTRRGFEGDISEAAGDLLYNLAIASKTYKELIEFGTWTQIIQVGVETFQTLAPKAVEDVGKSLTTVLGDVVVDQLLIPSYACLLEFSESYQRQNVEHQHSVGNPAERVIAILNLIRGVAKCDMIGERTRQSLTDCIETSSNNSGSISSNISSNNNSINNSNRNNSNNHITAASRTGPGQVSDTNHSIMERGGKGVIEVCMRSFGRTRPEVSRVIMLLVDDIVYNMLGRLSSIGDMESTKRLLSSVLTLMKGHVEVLAQQDLSLEDLGMDVEDMLSMLAHILDEQQQYDEARLLRPGEPDDGDEDDVGKVCFYGLSTLLPMINEAVLDIPSVNRTFFSLISQLVCTHADKVVLLPPDFSVKIVQSIDMQRASFDSGSERKALEAIAALGRVRARTRRNPKYAQASSAGVVDDALRKFLIAIFEAIANGSAHTSNLDAAADALLPLCHVDAGEADAHQAVVGQDGSNGGDKQKLVAFERVAQALLASTGNNAQLHAAVVQLAEVASEAGMMHGLGGLRDSNNINGTNNNLYNNGGRAGRLLATKRFREAVADFSTHARNCLLSVALASSSVPLPSA